jgi:predicted RNA-binding protein
MSTSGGRQAIHMILRLPRRRRDAGVPEFCPSLIGCGRACSLLAFGLPLFLIFVFGFQTAGAQEQRKRKVPIVDKLTNGGSRQAFSGKVETLDLERHVLELNATESKTLEIFPVKKGIPVSSAEGERMKLSQLKPGNEVIVYYEQKGDRRTVKDIVVLTAGDADKPKRSAPPS